MVSHAGKMGGQGDVIHWATAQSQLGAMLLAATMKGICRLSFDEDAAALGRHFPAATLIEGGAPVDRLMAGALAAVAMPANMPDLPLDLAGTPFQMAVWAELRRIPPGQTRSYAALAAAVGKPDAVRAAGSANGANPVAVLVPCHRVVRSDGALGGYAYGLARKAALLVAEGARDPMLI